MDFTPLHGYARSVPENVYFMRLMVVNAAIRAVNSVWRLDDVRQLVDRVEELKALERGRTDVPPMPELFGASEPGTGPQTRQEGRPSPTAPSGAAPVDAPADARAATPLPPQSYPLNHRRACSPDTQTAATAPDSRRGPTL